MKEPPPGEGGGSPGCGLSVVLSTAGIRTGSSVVALEGDASVEAGCGHMVTVIAHLASLRASNMVPGFSTALLVPLATDDKESLFSPTIHLLSIP